MEIQEFQNKLNEIRQAAAGNGNKLTAGQIRHFFGEMQLDKEQLMTIVKFLNMQGITIEGIETQEEEKTENEEQEWDYRKVPGAEALFEAFQKQEAGARDRLIEAYLPVARNLAMQICQDQEVLPDLIQEATVSMLMALSQEKPEKKEDHWFQQEIFSGLKLAREAQQQQKYEDDCLVERVRKLEETVRELSDDDGEEGQGSKFSLEDLAIILDMDAEEIEDVLRLTGEK